MSAPRDFYRPSTRVDLPHCREFLVSAVSDEAPRHIVLVWRIEEAYAAMRVSHQSCEHKHRDLRIQYLVAPDCLALRPKRPGMAWQQLRASAAMLIEWLRVFQRGG